MLRKLRLKIIAVVMSISVAVMAVAFAAIMASSWTSACEPLKHEMQSAVARGAEKDAVIVLGKHLAPGEPAGEVRDVSFTPVAVVSLSAGGTVEAHNDTFLAMDATVRAAALERVLASERDTGLISEAGVLYYRCASEYGVSVAFVDASALTATMQVTARRVACVFAGVLAMLLLVSIGLSRLVTRPVQQAWERQGEFVADASHELKTPLTVILANVNILQAHPGALTGEQEKWVAGIGSEARRMKGLVEELLFLARSDAGSPARAPEELPEVDLADVVRQSCLAFDAVAFEAGVTLEADDVAAAAPVRGERAKLERLVNILVDNAVKYAGRRGRVRVTLAARKRGHAVLRVNNTGDPIPEEELPRVFDRFWRSDRARSAPAGTGTASFGLGLAIAKSIAEEAGGHIGVASDAADGTTFTVTL